MLELSDLYERAFGCVPVEEINAAWFIEALTLHRRLQASVARRSVDIVGGHGGRRRAPPR